MEAKLNRKQKNLVSQFLEFSGSRDKKLAATILKDVKWNVDQAIDVYFSNYAGQVSMEVDENVEEVNPKVDSSSIDEEFV